MPLKKQIVFVLCALLIGNLSPAAASDQFLDTCLKVAEARDKRLAVAKEQNDLSKVKCIRSARAFFPMVAVQRKYSQGKTITDEYRSEELGVRLSQPLFEGGRARYTYRYDKMTLEASQYNYTKVREELFYKIKLAYYEMLTLRMEYNTLKKTFTEIEKLHDKVRIEYNAKAISELDLLEAENFRNKIEDLIRTSEINLSLATKKMTTFINIDSLDDIMVPIPDGLSDDVPEISFTLKDCLGFVPTNNIDVKLYQLQTQMADYRKKINRSKAIPKIYLNGYYGQSGEAYTSAPITPTTIWSVSGMLAWTLWGNTLEATQTTDHTVPTSIVDVSNKVDSSSLDLKLSLFDDIGYFVDAKESAVGIQQTQAELKEMMDKSYLELEKAYNDYESSLRTARQLKQEISLKRRNLDVLRKRNQLYEVPTVQVMEESWKYADLISQYSRAVYQNYGSVTEMERLTLMPLR